MALWGRSVGVLLWKNWRVKQRESRLNRGRAANRWLFPALLTDIVLPLGLLLLFIQKLCEYNAQLATPTTLGGAQGRHMQDQHAIASAHPLQPAHELLQLQRALHGVPDIDSAAASALLASWGGSTPQSVAHKPASLLIAVLPLLLEKSNQSLAVLDRKEPKEFLAYLDREYPGASELGISSIASLTKTVPFDAGSASNDQADAALLSYPKKSGLHIYVGLDVRHSVSNRKRRDQEKSSPLELLALFYRKKMGSPEAEAAADQLTKFYSEDLEFHGEDGPMHFPSVLPFQMTLNRFLRANATSSAVSGTTESNYTLPSPSSACRTVNKMLEAGGLDWTDLSSTSPLGHSLRECVVAVDQDELSTEIKRFLANLVAKAASEDELDNLSVLALPKRPATTVAGALESNIVFYMAYLFLWPYVRLVRDIVTEKEKQLKEYLLIMGLAPMALLVSWFLLYFLASATVSLLAVWLLSGTMFAATTAGNCYFFLLLMVFVTTILLFGVAVTPIFSQTKTAAACAPLMYLVLSAGTFVRSLVGEDRIAASPALGFSLVLLDSISSPVVFMASLHDILAFDAVTAAIRPITWRTVATPCRLMALQSAGYLVLGWYLENVFPRTYGVQQKWYFVFLPSYWWPKKASWASGEEEDSPEAVRLTEMGPGSFDDRQDDTLREQPLAEYLQHFKPTLFVQSLSKRYPNGKEALKGVSFGVRKGEIFGLLGPNGAGKSTTLSILCGMLSPTSGDAYVGGSTSVAVDPQAVRQSLSVCFQQNILFDDLSVWEHLSLVCALKASMGIKVLAQEAWRNKLQQFGLEEKRDALAKTLSGGQKRKLSLVLALLDSSRVVLLDEPTAGMDLKARLDTWDALKRAVSHRAVILTTHSMQEAQALCENIGIVADGKLKCCGSSLFLRNRFGVGYKLTVVHHDDLGKDDERSHLSGVRRQARAEALMSAVRKFVPKATVVSDNKWETRLQLTEGEEHRFAELFGELETMKKDAVIKRYAIAATNLEDVFVKVTEGEDVYYHAKDDDEDGDIDAPDSSDSAAPSFKPSKSIMKSETPASLIHGEDVRLPRWKQVLSQLRALIVKRWKMTARDKKALFAQYVWPVAIFVVFMMVVQHLATAGGSIETITTLSPSAKSSSLFVASAPDAADSVSRIVAEIQKSSHPVVFDSSVTTEQAMLASISRENTTEFFAGVFVSTVNWTSMDKLVASDGMAYSLYYNQTVGQSLPVTLQWMAQAYCKALAKTHGGDTHAESCELAVKKGIFPIDIKVGSEMDGGMGIDPDEAINVVRRIMVAFYLLVTMSSLVSYYIAPVVKEKENGLKRLQFMHLESPKASLLYWTSNFLFDYTAYLLASSAVFVVLALFSVSLTSEILTAWLAGMVLFGLAVLPFLYVCSLIFSSHSSAQAYMSYVSLFQILAASVVFALSMIPGLCAKVNTVAYFLQVLPLYTFGVLVLDVVTVSWTPMREQCLAMSGTDGFMGDLNALAGLETQPSVWDWNVTGSNFFVLAASAVGYMLILLAFDQKQMHPTVVDHKIHKTFRWVQRWLLPCWRSYGQGYTEAEQMAVEYDEENPDMDMVRVIRVCKVFNPRKTSTPPTGEEPQEGGEAAAAVVNQSGQVVALDDVSFSVERSDCVALLGVNGSGKSTMFEILTAGIAPTTGKALIDSCDVTLQPQEASARYGYCPQTNIFFSEMNVREHLELFYRLRCRGRKALLAEGAVIDALMQRLDLFPVETTASGHLSGGNKRRLMLALALLSDHTSLLLLDEPSAGVDVVARRLMWRVLHEKRQSAHRTSCLFTTHSMEEAEAVCANAVVLFKGKLVWCGSIPDLKQHASRGISISVRLDSAALWQPEQVQLYTEHIRRSLEAQPGTNALSAALEKSSLPLSELENVWELCHALRYKSDSDVATIAASRQHGKQWLAGLRSRFESDDSGSSTVSGSARTSSMDAESGVVSIVEFVKEWLVQEAFARLETEFFKDEISRRSGEPVTPVDLETARGSGSNTSGVYETSCTENFGLADAFSLMEASKTRFAVSHYSISELSLERVFEQFS